MDCKLCGLCIHSEPSCIWGSGNNHADIMIISSYAGDEDEEKGEATMSPTLLKYLDQYGIDSSQVYYTNAIKCRTPRGIKFKVGDIKKCKAYLDQEIEQVSPKFILIIGAQAMKATLDQPLTSTLGTTIEKNHIKYVPTYSPGIIFRDPGKAEFVDQAFRNFANLINGIEVKLPELNIKVLTTKGQIKKALNHIKKKGYKALSYDIESTGLNRFEDKITLLGFGNKQVQYIIPLEVRFSPLRGKLLAQKELVRYAVKGLNKDTETLIAGNGKFDNLFLKEHFKIKPQLDFDIILASHILDENTPNGVKENAVKECNAPNWDVDLKLKQGNVETREDYEKYLTYLGYDIYFEYSLYEIFEERIKGDPSLHKLYYHLYMPGIRAYEDIEERGVYVYPRKFKRARKKLEKALGKVERKLNRYKKGVNWSSPAQVAEFLYEDLKLPIIETTDTGNPSTGESTLLQLRDKHKAVELILEYRGIKIQISHFIDGWINRMHKGRLFPHFKLHGTVTGRTSCTDPNLQQVPRDPTIRGLLGAPEGYTFVEADFSQAELRIATILSGDTTMKRIYQTGGDIHTETYELVTHETISDDPKIRKEQRKKAKAVNFGFLYGMGWRKFKDYARDSYGVKLTDREAKEYRINFFKAYHSLPDWHKKQRKVVKALGQVRNPIGRIRRLPDIYSSDEGKVAEAERQSINSPVQGFGSDLTILAMVEVSGHANVYHRKLQLDRSKFYTVGTVHDATLFEVRNDYLIEFISKAKKVMEAPRALSKVFKYEAPIPMIVDFTIGKFWGDGAIELDFEGGKWKRQVEEYLALQN